MTTIKRKGARSIKDIPAAILQQLNTGRIETANLVEWLAVDQRILLKSLLTDYKRTVYLKPILTKIDKLEKQTVNTINEAIGTGIFELTAQQQDTDFLTCLFHHPSDLVRCWATYTSGKDPALDINHTLTRIKPFAADKHFGVREICWMAVRPKITQYLPESIALLTQWTSHEDENIRRFTTESIRPRGVWCAHIEQLKATPALALPVLLPLQADTSRYVQDSVGNWLNDASKTQPGFVISLCNTWEKQSDSKATKYIIQKALRTIHKKT